MRLRPAVIAVVLAALASAASAQGDSAAPAAALIKSFTTTTGLSWQDIDARRDIRWVAGLTLLKTNAPDGSSFARPGVATIAGHTFDVAATGARAGVASIYLSEAVPAAPAETVAQGLRADGLVLTPIRCARDPARPDRFRGWYHLSAGPAQGSLYIGRLASGRQGYTVFEGDPPPMTQAEAAAFVGCPGGQTMPVVSGAPQTGQAGIVAVIEALLRPQGAPARIAWRSPLPAIRWNRVGPQHFQRPAFSFGGADTNPQILDGDFKTPTTVMTVTATGDARGADRFYLEGGGHLPRDAVFNALRRDGYTLTALICGKPYIKMSENWFRISGPGRQPAILYRSMSVSTGEPTENYAVRLDNAPPALQPGQRAANGGGCPG